MKRAEFIATLRRKLAAIPDAQRETIIADYDSYFGEGIAAGRGEEQVAAALGDPARLAAELTVDLSIAEWRVAPSHRAALRNIAGILRLLLLDGFVLVPFVLAVCLLAALFIGAMLALIYGGFATTVLPFDAPPGGPLAALLRGIGFLSSGVAAIALCAVLTHALAAAVARVAAAHRRALRLPNPPNNPPGVP